jgi:dihydroneopterin aldolase/D-erythro-7,8-dihydroneopterin triphosphate epimerase
MDPAPSHPLDRIHIEGLLLRCIIGTNDWEREQKQDVLITITLQTDTRAAGRSDRIEDTVNYRSLTKRIIEHVEASQFFLVEALAESIATLCLSDPRVAAAEVRVEKPGALRFARSVGVTITRARLASGNA